MTIGHEHPRPDSRRWWHDAACRGMDPNLFFPLSAHLDVAALDACSCCTVRSDCHDDAIAEGRGFDDQLGYRAGMTPRDRYNLRRKLRRIASKAAQEAAP